MTFFYNIHYQIKSFFSSGKKIRKPINKTELIISRLIAFLLLALAINLFGYLFRFKFLPLIIYLRSLIVLVPMITFMIKFFQGISISWIIRGIKKYWLVPLILLSIYLSLVYVFYHIISSTSFNLTLFYLVVGTLIFFIGFCGSIYFLVESYYLRCNVTKTLTERLKMLFYLVLGLFFITFLIGGLLYLAAGLQLIDLEV